MAHSSGMVHRVKGVFEHVTKHRNKVGEVVVVVFLCLLFDLCNTDPGVCRGEGWGDEVIANIGRLIHGMIALYRQNARGSIM